MIRLINKKVFQYKENDTIEYDAYGNNKEKLKETLEADVLKLESIPVVNDYKSFLNEINNLVDAMIPALAIIEYDPENNVIYVFRKKPYAKYAKLVVKYKPENDDMINFLEKLLYINSEKTSTIFEICALNDFNFITEKNVLELLLTNTYLKSIGEKPFQTFKLKSKNGKIRDIVAPHEDIKTCLRKLNELFQRVYDKRNIDFQIAYKKGKNIKTGAKLHTNHKYVYNIDLKDFYPSCKKDIVRKYTNFMFTGTFNREFVEEEFFSIILKDDGLFIGSPISGALANAIISAPVKYLSNICKKFDITVSVYADDITFSSDKFITKDFVLNLFDNAFSKYNLSEYFKINKKKCVGFSGCNRKVTGVSINNNDQITVSRRYYRNIRTQLEHLSRGDNIDISALRGKIAYAVYMDDSGKILRYLKKFEQTVKEHNLYSGKL